VRKADSNNHTHSMKLHCVLEWSLARFHSRKCRKWM